MELRHRLRQYAADSPADFTKVCGASELQAYVQLVPTCAHRWDKLCAHAFVELAAVDPEASVLELAGGVIGLNLGT